uniref:OmpA family protein n=1 Tax=uncultured Psychrobacter sp. TaxID=259303 RepID=UPI00262AE848|nr:OmpA family protein [uncultured Psychrobacter sp.]
MKTKLRNTFLILVSTLTLSACQTSVSQNQATQTTDLPVAKVILDSDGDGVPDDIDECPGTPINIVPDEQGCPSYSDDNLGVKIEYRAFFAKGSSELSKEYQLELDKVAQKLQEYNTATMRIEAHASTDEVSAVDAVLQPNALSRNRALIVKNYLIMQHKIDPDRLSIASYGAEQPIAPSDTEEGKSMNRRVYGVATEPKDGVVYHNQND